MQPKESKFLKSPILSKDSTVVGNFESIERLRTLAEALEGGNLKDLMKSSMPKPLGELVNRKSMESIIQER